ncbi:MAG: hypothetical protein JXR46_01090 [Calditrichaceae bacterium]|nr:hypothetical protein [Calditrichaceae bacterium]MBN2707611.1 hypothetical protein [Calditrichaceae bacterium]RQV93213.1 MAG: hypothetical protein EH224_13045 [Calditrichota bacterium]
MKTRILGLLTLIMASMAYIIGLYVACSYSPWMGILYALLILLCVPVILYAYCRKCPAQNSCAHYLPAVLCRLLPARKQQPYTIKDITAVSISFIILTAVPQRWLIDEPALLILFWVLLITAALIIVLNLCGKCTNRYCAFCRNHSIIEL